MRKTSPTFLLAAGFHFVNTRRGDWERKSWLFGPSFPILAIKLNKARVEIQTNFSLVEIIFICEEVWFLKCDLCPPWIAVEIPISKKPFKVTF